MTMRAAAGHTAKEPPHENAPATATKAADAPTPSPQGSTASGAESWCQTRLHLLR